MFWFGSEVCWFGVDCGCSFLVFRVLLFFFVCVVWFCWFLSFVMGFVVVGICAAAFCQVLSFSFCVFLCVLLLCVCLLFCVFWLELPCFALSFVLER